MPPLKNSLAYGSDTICENVCPLVMSTARIDQNANVYVRFSVTTVTDPGAVRLQLSAPGTSVPLLIVVVPVPAVRRATRCVPLPLPGLMSTYFQSTDTIME